MIRITDSVKAFYEELPFNYEQKTSEQTEAIKKLNQLEAYPPLAIYLSKNPGIKLLDAGCGAGWFSNSAAFWYGLDVWGIDVCKKAVDRAKDVAGELELASRVRYINSDLFKLPEVIQEKFDVVNSLGVLHHTKDCYKAFMLVTSMIKSGGYLNIGLYHRYGRQPLLEMFQPIRDSLSEELSPSERTIIEEKGFNMWKSLHGKSFSEIFLRSWYRDQCLHPHETQWTLKEVLEWCDVCGIKPLQTSLDRFQENPDFNEITRNEKDQEKRGYTRLHDEKKYFPGFFVLWGRKL